MADQPQPRVTVTAARCTSACNGCRFPTSKYGPHRSTPSRRGLRRGGRGAVPGEFPGRPNSLRTLMSVNRTPLPKPRLDWLVLLDGILRSALAGKRAVLVGLVAVATDDVLEALALGEHGAAERHAKRQYSERSQRWQAARDDTHSAFDQAPGYRSHLCPLALVSLHSPLSPFPLLRLGRGGGGGGG